METKQEINSISLYLKEHPRKHKLLNEENSINDRIKAELLVIQQATVDYLKGDLTMVVRLQTIKDYLCSIKGNIFGMDLDGGANAQIQKDALKVCRNLLEVNGVKYDIHCKQINKNAIVFIDIASATKLITEEKDIKRKELYKERLQAVIKMPTRQGYERRV